MGLFNLFGKKNSIPKMKDLVWKNQIGKHNACLNLNNQFPGAVWISWFSETQKDFNNFIGTKNQVFPDIKMARAIQSYMVADKTVIFLEHYPLRTVEEDLIQSWESKEIFVLNSLDEPLFEQFGGQRIVGLMESLGMKDDEQIEHPMIGKSIKNAQDKLQKKITIESSANSSKDWFKMNFG